MEGKLKASNDNEQRGRVEERHGVDGLYSSDKLPQNIRDAKYSTDPAKRKLFDGFIERERQIAERVGASALDHAERSRINAEANLSFERERFEEYTQQIEQLRNEIDIKKSSLITKILEFRQIRELKARLDLRERMVSNTENSLNEKKELVEVYDYMIAEEKKLIVLTDAINNENIERDNKRILEHQEDEKRRTVGGLASRHGVFFVHDIVVADWKPSENNRAIDTQKLDFNDQLDIVLGIAPTISVSTLKQDTKQRTFGEGSWGVFLSGGRVAGGEPSDAGTVAYGFRSRILTGGDQNKTIAGIDDAINGQYSPRKSGYNELVVEKPEVSGVYVKWGDEGWPELKKDEDIFLSAKMTTYKDRDRFAPWWEKMSSVLKRGVPIFVIDQKNNHVRMLYDIDIKNKTFKVTPEYNPSEVVDMPGIYKQHLGEVEKRQAVMRVYDKVSGSLTEEEQKNYKPDGTEGDSRGMISVH